MGQEDRAAPSQSAARLRARAQDFQQLAETSHTIAVAAALLKIADRYQALAEVREQEDVRERSS